MLAATNVRGVLIRFIPANQLCADPAHYTPFVPCYTDQTCRRCNVQSFRVANTILGEKAPSSTFDTSEHFKLSSLEIGTLVHKDIF